MPGVLGARLESVHVSVASVQIQEPVPVSDCAVVFGGNVSVKFTVVAALGPILFTCCVYVMLLPICTPIGLAVFVTDRSAKVLTYVFTVTLLLPPFGSLVEELTVSTSEMYPVAAVGGMESVSVKFPTVVLAAKLLPSVHVRVASVHVHPVGPVSPLAVVPVGMVSSSVGVVAGAGPLLVMVCV